MEVDDSSLFTDITHRLIIRSTKTWEIISTNHLLDYSSQMTALMIMLPSEEGLMGVNTHLLELDEVDFERIVPPSYVCLGEEFSSFPSPR